MFIIAINIIISDSTTILIVIPTDKGNGSEEDDDGGPVVEPEHVVVDADRVPLVEQSGDPPEDERKHAAKEYS